MYNIRDDDYANQIVAQRFEYIDPFIANAIPERIDLYNREYVSDDITFGYTKEIVDTDIPIIIPRPEQVSTYQKPILSPRYKLEWDLFISERKYKEFLILNKKFVDTAELYFMKFSQDWLLGTEGLLKLSLYDYRLEASESRQYDKYNIIFTKIGPPLEYFLSDKKVRVKISGEVIETDGFAPVQIPTPYTDSFIYDYDKDLPPI